jgi:ABC-type branched-subunit amino acid transport system ATPase component
MVDEIIIMEKGRIVRKGPYRDVSTTPEFMKLFLQA